MTWCVMVVLHGASSCIKNSLYQYVDEYCKVRNIDVLKFSELINFSILANRNISV